MLKINITKQQEFSLSIHSFCYFQSKFNECVSKIRTNVVLSKDYMDSSSCNLHYLVKNAKLSRTNHMPSWLSAYLAMHRDIYFYLQVHLHCE
jgi:hypothetical protein